MNDRKAQTAGAWIVHHGRKLRQVDTGGAEFPVLDQTAKAAELLIALGETNQSNLDTRSIDAICQSLGLNPRIEKDSLLGILKKNRLIDIGTDGIDILGVTTGSVLGHAAEIFQTEGASRLEAASLALAEITSKQPVLTGSISEVIGDKFKMTSAETTEFIGKATRVGFVDYEDDGSERLLFNGNLFRRGAVKKTERILSSLTVADQALVAELSQKLNQSGCVSFATAEKILGSKLLEKLQAASFYDVSTVSNETGDHAYITSPSAFHKFVNPLVDDSFDLAKTLVAALRYGMDSRPASQGRINDISALLRKLISGSPVGPATAIGSDYRILETRRVVKIKKTNGRYLMFLLKRDIGEIALSVLKGGDANAESMAQMVSASIASFKGPEHNRSVRRKMQEPMSKKATLNVLSALRGGVDV